MSVEPLLSDLLRMTAGIPVALEMVGVSMTFGTILAVLIAVARSSGLSWLGWLAYAYIYVIRGTPFLLQLFFIYYGFSQFAAVRESVLWPLFREPFFCAVLALSLSTAAYGSEIIRGGLKAVQPGLIDAASALGMNEWQRFRLVSLPLALRQMLPAYGNEAIMLIKATSITSTITIMDVTGIARTIAAETYAPVSAFMAATLIYFALNTGLTVVLRLAEYRLSLRGSLN